MGNGSGVSRGGRNRNARVERLRALVPVTNAIAGIGLAGKMQMVAVTDHDSKVMARGRSGTGAWDVGSALDWAAGRAGAKGWAGVIVSCEPAGRWWRRAPAYAPVTLWRGGQRRGLLVLGVCSLAAHLPGRHRLLCLPLTKY